MTPQYKAHYQNPLPSHPPRALPLSLPLLRINCLAIAVKNCLSRQDWVDLPVPAGLQDSEWRKFVGCEGMGLGPIRATLWACTARAKPSLAHLGEQPKTQSLVTNKLKLNSPHSTTQLDLAYLIGQFEPNHASQPPERSRPVSRYAAPQASSQQGDQEGTSGRARTHRRAHAAGSINLATHSNCSGGQSRW